MSSLSKILVSACLLGEKVRYDGGHAWCADPVLERWAREGSLISFCPETAAGLPAPRPPDEIVDGRVIDAEGHDMTSVFDAGAHLALKICRTHDIRLAILKENSPSCGSGFIYDGTFGGVKIPGQGRTAGLLSRHGVAVFSEDRIAEAERFLARL
jgi:uncharacterized protein YbbK (DUF523 family)